MPTISEIFATSCLGLAILHTFSVKRFQHIAGRYPEGSVGENFFHLLGEVEIVFGVWAGVFLILSGLAASMSRVGDLVTGLPPVGVPSVGVAAGISAVINYLQACNFTEPVFVFVIMSVCSTRPILNTSVQIIEALSKLIPLNRPLAFYLTCLILGPLMGSFITEPAAMTLTALILLDRFYSQKISHKLKYATLGLLFVNVSVGGVLTPFAAPPVLMVASRWHWDLGFMLSHFGWRAVLSIFLSTACITFCFKKELARLSWNHSFNKMRKIPVWVSFTHFLFLALIVTTAHYMVVFVGIFLFFLGLASVTKEYQHELKLREGLLVAFFLSGLVILGGLQQWWLGPILVQLNAASLFIGSMALTAIVDNAALTYLGSQVPSLSEASRYALVAGAIAAGGLTVIANAPNPAGYTILNSSFGKEGISPLLLFVYAFVPTVIAGLCFWVL